MRTILIPLALLSSGCALLLQDQLPTGYDGTTKPTDCDEVSGTGIADIVFGAANIVGIAYSASATDDTEQLAGVTLNAVELFIHAVSAGAGFKWASNCREAKASWANGADARDAAVNAERGQAAESRAARREAKEWEAKRQFAALAPAVPRGFFCSVSAAAPLAGLCTRQKTDCSRARDAAIAAVPDLAECTLVETAWCFDAGSGNDDERCAPVQDGCVAMHARAATAGTVGDCAEVE